MDSLTAAIAAARVSIDTVLNDLEARMREELARTAAGAAAESAREETAESLNNVSRRLREAGSRDVWARTLLEATEAYCPKAALFSITGDAIRFEGARGADVPRGMQIPLASAPAFAGAVEAMDTVVAVGTPRELSQTVSGMLGNASDRRVYLFPLIAEGKVVAVLYADPAGETVHVSGLELLATLAAASIRQPEEAPAPPEPTPPPAPAPELVRIAAPQPRRATATELRAQRFARTSVARIILRRTEAIRRGRASQNLYGTLKEEIDAGRDAFRQQFLDGNPSMPDYFHGEVVATLAGGDASLLGSDYPGALR